MENVDLEGGAGNVIGVNGDTWAASPRKTAHQTQSHVKYQMNLISLHLLSIRLYIIFIPFILIQQIFIYLSFLIIFLFFFFPFPKCYPLVHCGYLDLGCNLQMS